MATIDQIVENEDQNRDRIHLYRIGLFYRAFQRSAYLFLTNVRNFRAVKKHYKATRCDVVMLGFPSSLLDELLPPESVETHEDGHISVSSPALDLQLYQAWFATVKIEPEKKKAVKIETIPQAPKVAPAQPQLPFAPAPAPCGEIQNRVLRDLETFPVENSTPLDCMIFLSKLKSELKKGTTRGNL